MKKAEHKALHVQLHEALDLLAADYLLHNPDRGLEDSTIMDLMVWSRKQTRNPLPVPGTCHDDDAN